MSEVPTPTICGGWEVSKRSASITASAFVQLMTLPLRVARLTQKVLFFHM